MTGSSKIGPVCLPNAGLNITAPETFWVTFYGQITNGDSRFLYLVEAQVSLTDSAECNSSMAYDGKISQDMLCTRQMKAEDRRCHSDSGGPLVSFRDGLWWFVGDSIWPENCSVQSKPGVYGDITHFLDWIYYQMKKHQES
ncbi:transmembrane protease serine 2-like [Cololabis saira]|uniref:transmembrane protease serine 2-like n=1 Tax=Cololabis saira TaxID=129043 RepID=UPI002AD1E774|nr:transmembrane protease serine 2-like [Cololabis saira]